MEITNKPKKIEILEDLFNIREHVTDHRLARHLIALHAKGETDVDYTKRGNHFLSLRLRKFLLDYCKTAQYRLRTMTSEDFNNKILTDEFLLAFQQEERKRINEQLLKRAEKLMS